MLVCDNKRAKTVTEECGSHLSLSLCRLPSHVWTLLYLRNVFSRLFSCQTCSQMWSISTLMQPGGHVSDMETVVFISQRAGCWPAAFSYSDSLFYFSSLCSTSSPVLPLGPNKPVSLQFSVAQVKKRFHHQNVQRAIAVTCRCVCSWSTVGSIDQLLETKHSLFKMK